MTWDSPPPSSSGKCRLTIGILTKNEITMEVLGGAIFRSTKNLAGRICLIFGSVFLYNDDLRIGLPF